MIRFLSVIFFIGAVQCIPQLPIAPCNYNDTFCMVEAQNRHYQIFIPTYHLDPLHVISFNASSLTLELTFLDPALNGLEGCSVTVVRLDVETRKLRHTLACPRVIMTGFYRAKGLVLELLPVDGDGPFYLIFYDYAITYEADISIYEGVNEKDYLRIGNVTRLEYEPRGDIVLSFKNLVRGNKQASEEAQRFFNENARPIVLAYQKPIVDNYVTVVLRRLNYYFWKVPMIDIFSGPQLKW